MEGARCLVKLNSDERFRACMRGQEASSCRIDGTGASALLMKDAGFEALGTSSAAIALSLGRMDGRHAVSRDEHLANARLLIRVDRVTR